MDYNNRFDQIESLLTGLLRSSDRQNEILEKQNHVLERQGELLDTHRDILTSIGGGISQQTDFLKQLYDKIDVVEENRKGDAGNVYMLMKNIDAQLKELKPLLEQVIDQKQRIQRLEDAVFKKSA